MDPLLRNLLFSILLALFLGQFFLHGPTEAWERTRDFPNVDTAQPIKVKSENLADQAKEKAEEVKNYAADTAQNMKERSENLAERAKEKTKDAAQTVKDTASNLGEKAKEKTYNAAHNIKEGIEESASNLAEGAREKMKEMGENVRDAAERAKEGTQTVGREAVDSVKDAAERAQDRARETAYGTRDSSNEAAFREKERAEYAAEKPHLRGYDTINKAEQAIKDVGREGSQQFREMETEGEQERLKERGMPGDEKTFTERAKETWQATKEKAKELGQKLGFNDDEASKERNIP